MLTGASYGSLFCGDLDRVDDQLKVALDEADRVGVDKLSVVYKTAKSFYDRTAGFFGEAPVLPSSCAAVTKEGLSALKDLNDLIKIHGGQTVKPPEQGQDPIETFKTVIIWAGVGLGLLYLGPPILSAISGFVTNRPRRLSGYRRRKHR